MSDYPIIVTQHARERYIVRVVDPQKFGHLETCKGCGQCVNLLYEINILMRSMRKHMDRHISRQALKCMEQNEKVTDPLFLQTIKTHYPKEVFEETTYYIDRSTPTPLIFVVKKGDPPILKTVLTWDMIDGTILRHCQNQEETTKVFKTWKFRDKMKGKNVGNV